LGFIQENVIVILGILNKLKLHLKSAALLLIALNICGTPALSSAQEPNAMYQKAHELYAQNDFWQAVLTFTSFSTTFPRDKRVQEALLYAGEALHEMEMHSAALLIYKKINDSFPSNTFSHRVLYKQIYLSLITRKYEAAIKAFELLAEKHKASKYYYPGLFRAAQCYYKLEQFMKVTDLLKDFPENEQGFAGANYLMALASVQLGQLQQVESYFNNTVDSPHSAEEKLLGNKAILFAAHALYETRKFAYAIKLYNKIPEKNELYVDAQRGLAWCYINQGNYDKAIQYLTTIINLKPSSDFAMDASLAIAYSFGKQKKYSKSIAIFKKLIRTTSKQAVFEIEKRKLAKKVSTAELILNSAESNLNKVNQLIIRNQDIISLKKTGLLNRQAEAKEILKVKELALFAVQEEGEGKSEEELQQSGLGAKIISAEDDYLEALERVENVNKSIYIEIILAVRKANLAKVLAEAKEKVRIAEERILKVAKMITDELNARKEGAQFEVAKAEDEFVVIENNLFQVEESIVNNLLHQDGTTNAFKNPLKRYNNLKQVIQKSKVNIENVDKRGRLKIKLLKILQEAQYSLPIMLQRQTKVSKEALFEEELTEKLRAPRQEQEDSLVALKLRILDSFNTKYGEDNFTLKMVEAEFEIQKKSISFLYENQIKKIEAKHSEDLAQIHSKDIDIRSSAIKHYEKYISQYDDNTTENVMYQLGRLYYSEEQDHYFSKMESYNQKMDEFFNSKNEEAPPEPLPNYPKTIQLYQKIINKYPKSANLAQAYYGMGYCYLEQNAIDTAMIEFNKVVNKFSQSSYYPEANLRLGEIYFMDKNYIAAITYYKNILLKPKSSSFEKALYKLGWSYFNLNDYENAINTFVAVVDYDKEINTQKADLRHEALEYIAISFNEYGGLENMLDYFKQIDGRPYEFELEKRLGNILLKIDKLNGAREVFSNMVKRYPEHPEIPLIENSIAECYLRLQHIDKLSMVRERFIQKYGLETAWRKNNKDDEKAIIAANNLLEQYYYNTGSFMHVKARSTNDRALYKKTIDRYREFISIFPNSNYGYEAQYLLAEAYYEIKDFENAIANYDPLIYEYKDRLKYRENAALSKLICYRSIKKDLDENKKSDPKDISKVKQQILTASEEFRNINPDSKHVPRLLYMEGKSYMEDKLYDMALISFQSIVENYPAHKLYNNASENTARAYLKLKNFSQAENWYKKNLNVKSNTPDQKKEISSFIVAAIYENANLLRNNNNLLEAAREYERLVKEFPQFDKAPEALAAAGICYDSLDQKSYAVEIYEMIINEYPTSASAQEALWRAAADYESLNKWDLVVKKYIIIADKFPDSKNAPLALRNAGFAYEQLNDFNKAAATYNKLVDNYPKSRAAEDALFNLATTYETNNNWVHAAKTFEKYARLYTSDKNFLVEARCRAGIDLFKAGKYSLAGKKLKTALNEYKKYKKVDDTYPAEAQFTLAELDYRKYRNIANGVPGDQGNKNLKAKAVLIKSMREKYNKTIKFGIDEWVTASLYRMGSGMAEYATAISAQHRETMDEKQTLWYEINLQTSQIPQFMERSAQYYEANMKISQKNKLRNTWIDSSGIKYSRILHKLGNILEKVSVLHGKASQEKEAAIYLKKAQSTYLMNLKKSGKYELKNIWVNYSLQKLSKLAPEKAKKFSKVKIKQKPAIKKTQIPKTSQNTTTEPTLITPVRDSINSNDTKSKEKQE